MTETGNVREGLKDNDPKEEETEEAEKVIVIILDGRITADLIRVTTLVIKERDG